MSDRLREAAQAVVDQLARRYDDQWATGPVYLVDLDTLRAALEAWDRVTSIEYRNIDEGTLAEPMNRLRAALAEPPADTPKLPPPEWWRARGEHPPVDDNEARARFARLADPERG